MDTHMAKPEWGVKRSCPSCASRFYDLLRDPVVCPACGESFGLDVFTKPRRGKAAAAAPSKAPVKAVEAEEEDLETVDIDESLDDSEDDDVLDLETDESDDLPAAKSASGDEDSESDSSGVEFPDDDILDDDEGSDDDDDEVSLDSLESDDGDADEEDET